MNRSGEGLERKGVARETHGAVFLPAENEARGVEQSLADHPVEEDFEPLCVAR